MDPVGSADGEGVGVLPCPSHEHLHQLLRARDDDLPGRLQLEGEAGVEDVRGGETEVDPAPGLARGRGQYVHEGGHVVVGDPLALFDVLDVEGGLANGRELVLRGTVLAEQERELFGGLHLDPTPRVHPRLVGPQAAELGPRVAGDHA